MNLRSTVFYFLLLILTWTSCKKDDPKPNDSSDPEPVANFSYAGTNIPAPCTVNFTNTSTNSESYTWDFGDNGTSNEKNPEHTYSKGGVYTVKLTAKGDGGSNSTSKTINISAAPTKVKINKVSISSLPFINSSGASWDISAGPDVYFDITDQNSNILLEGTSSRFMDIIPSDLPLTWTFTTPYEISNLVSSRFITVYDFDSPDLDDEIGYVGFKMSNYTTGSNPYPVSITETRNGITVTLTVSWE